MRLLSFLLFPVLTWGSILFPTSGTLVGTYQSKLSAYDHILSIDGSPVLDSELNSPGDTFHIHVEPGPLVADLFVKNTGLTYSFPDWHFFVMFPLPNNWVLWMEDLPIQNSYPTFFEGFEPDNNDWVVRLAFFGDSQPVPEASTMAFLGLGLACVGFWGRGKGLGSSKGGNRS